MIAQITLMAVFIFRIPLGYIIGDKGMAYFGLANEIFAVGREPLLTGCRKRLPCR